MGNVVEFEVFRDYLGVAAISTDVDDVSRLFDAVNAAIRRWTRRSFEGDEGGSYDQVIRIDGAVEFRLPQVPVAAVASIARVWFDGTEDTAYETTDWRLVNPATGLVALRPGADWHSSVWPGLGRSHNPEYIRAIWTTTGAIEADVALAALDWGKTSWDEHTQTAGLAGYTTGQDSETYFEKLIGRPPRSVMAALMGAQHLVGGGKVCWRSRPASATA